MHAQVAPEDLDNLKDSLEHYLDCAADPDFVEVGWACSMHAWGQCACECCEEMHCRPTQ